MSIFHKFYFTRSFVRSLSLDFARSPHARSFCSSRRVFVVFGEKIKCSDLKNWYLPLRNWQWFFIACNSLFSCRRVYSLPLAECYFVLFDCTRTLLCVFSVVRHRWERDFISIVGAIPLAYIFRSFSFRTIVCERKKWTRCECRKCFILDSRSCVRASELMCWAV